MDYKKIKEMMDSGMFIGCHGYEHHRMDMLTPKQQEDEIDMALDVLIDIGMSKENWIMCYQLGLYNNSLITTIKEKGCKLALTVKPNLANISIENAFTLERLDTIDLPCDRNAKLSKWTEKILVD
jgi:peptidoglycan/xylan/chitin deacetylase (PgdA/CDA1 family)